jgi:hypothetical protein
MLQGQEQAGQETGPAAEPVERQQQEPQQGPYCLCLPGNPERLAPLVETLREHGAPFEQEIDLLEQRLAQNPAARALVVFPNPVMYLVAQLEQGDALSAALAAWREQAEPLLALFRRDRARITLVDGHAALSATDEFYRQLETRLGMAVQTPDDPRAGAELESAGLLHLLAAQALTQDDAAGALLAELEASSLALGPAYRVDVQAILEQRSAPVSDPELDDLRAENALMRLQLRQLQAIYETQVLGDRRLEELRADTKRARLARKSVETDFKEAREAWREERKLLTDKLKWTADDLAAIRRSLSWRVTAPLRRVAGIFLGRSKL